MSLSRITMKHSLLFQFRSAFLLSVSGLLLLSASSALAQDASPGVPGQFSHEDAAPSAAGDGKYWWRGNLHTHTLWSDGDQFPEVATQWYVENGYHFLALSDHNILSRGERWVNPATNHHIARHGRMEAVDLYRERFGDDWVETREIADGGIQVRLKPLDEYRHLFEKPGRFLMIEAEEITEGRHAVHMNASNIRNLIRPQTGATVEETIRLNVEAVHGQARELGRPILPHLNHPNFRWAITAEDMAPVEGLNFFEVYNGHRGVRNFGDDIHLDLDRMWDIVLTKRLAELDLGIVYGLAVDDAHNHANSTSDGSRPGRGWVMVRSHYLTPKHLIAALRRGDFYSSSGVVLKEVEATEDFLRVEIEADPESDATYTIQFIGTRKGYDPSRAPVMARGEIGRIADIRDRWVFVQAVADRDAGKQTLRVYDPEGREWHEAAVDLPAGETSPNGMLHVPSDRFRFNGKLSDLRFWHRARSQDEADGDMGTRLLGDEAGLAGYWPFDASVSDAARERVGGRNAILRGGRFEAGSPIDGTRVLVTGGEFGEVRDREGLIPGGKSFTIEMWVNTDASASGWNLPFEWLGGDRVYVGQDAGDGWNFVVGTNGVRTDTEQGESGERVEIRTTQRYSDDVGEILQEVQGTNATYRFDGDEIYVRARVISSELHPNPFATGERQKAWIQPVVPGIGLLEATGHEAGE